MLTTAADCTACTKIFTEDLCADCALLEPQREYEISNEINSWTDEPEQLRGVRCRIVSRYGMDMGGSDCIVELLISAEELAQRTNTTVERARAWHSASEVLGEDRPGLFIANVLEALTRIK